MKIEQIYTGCLAQGAYYVESKGEVAIIDPLREVEPYIKRAKADDAHIKYIFGKRVLHTASHLVSYEYNLIGQFNIIRNVHTYFYLFFQHT